MVVVRAQRNTEKAILYNACAKMYEIVVKALYWHCNYFTGRTQVSVLYESTCIQVTGIQTRCLATSQKVQCTYIICLRGDRGLRGVVLGRKKVGRGE